MAPGEKGPAAITCVTFSRPKGKGKSLWSGGSVEKRKLARKSRHTGESVPRSRVSRYGIALGKRDHNEGEELCGEMPREGKEKGAHVEGKGRGVISYGFALPTHVWRDIEGF